VVAVAALAAALDEFETELMEDMGGSFRRTR